MNVVRFRQLVADAVASRESIDTDDFARLAAEAGDESFWRSQVDLDRAIATWSARTKERRSRRRVMRRVPVAVAALAAGVAVFWVARPEPIASDLLLKASMTVSAKAASVPAVPAVPSVAERLTPAPVVAPRPPQDQRLAEATATAERLAYAFQPVGEQVSSVVRLLIDSVPGADVLSL
jgi:hypothetical protein